MRAGFEGGQMPLYMRLGKLRGSNHRKSMPMGPFRTHTTPVNVRNLERFDAGVEVTPDLLKAAGVVGTLRHPVKILGNGELSRRLTVHAHAFSQPRRRADRGRRRQGRGDRRRPRPWPSREAEEAGEAEGRRRVEEPAAEAQDDAPEADAEAEAPETETETDE